MPEKSNIKKWIVLSQGWDGCPMAYHLQQEGYDVILGQIQDKSELKNGDDKEDPEDKKERLSQYEGMLKKVHAKDLVKALIQVENKDDYFIYCDQNSLWYYSELLVRAGFKNGLFPTKKDFDFEKSREEAMAFVKENYPDIEIIPFQEFSKVDEAKKFLESTPGVYVLQSRGDFVGTIVPTSDDDELATVQILNQLEKNKADYDKGGLILKTKLINPVEITPQIVFYQGEPVFTDLDIETKNIGNGINNGNQVGCGSNLIIKTSFRDKINKIAFPEIVYKMAKEHTGLFVWDISIYVHEGKLYFGEFCSNRLGYDSSMTEMDMSGGVGKYFEAIYASRNPLKKDFGTAVRIFNLNRSKDVKIAFDGIEEHVWLYEVKKVDEDLVSVGDCWDLGVITASSDDVEEAIDQLFEYRDKFMFKEMYSRTKSDFKEDYPTSILNRFNAINHKYIEVSDAIITNVELEKMKKQHKRDFSEQKKNHDSEIKNIKSVIKTIING